MVVKSKGDQLQVDLHDLEILQWQSPLGDFDSVEKLVSRMTALSGNEVGINCHENMKEHIWLLQNRLNKDQTVSCKWNLCYAFLHPHFSELHKRKQCSAECRDLSLVPLPIHSIIQMSAHVADHQLPLVKCSQAE